MYKIVEDRELLLGTLWRDNNSRQIFELVGVFQCPRVDESLVQLRRHGHKEGDSEIIVRTESEFDDMLYRDAPDREGYPGYYRFESVAIIEEARFRVSVSGTKQHNGIYRLSENKEIAIGSLWFNEATNRVYDLIAFDNRKDLISKTMIELADVTAASPSVVLDAVQLKTQYLPIELEF